MSEINEEHEFDMEQVLKRFALWGGLALAAVSIYFSYDGADQTINGGNPTYTDVAKVIMIVMALVVTLAQFIFNSDFSKLSTTMKLIGVTSYVYSLATNYMGINHLFGFHGLVGAGIAGFMDIAPEAFIAWSLDDSMRGDMLGNIGKFVVGSGKRTKSVKRQQIRQYNEDSEQRPRFSPELREKLGKSRKNSKSLFNSHTLHGVNQDKPNRFDL